MNKNQIISKLIGDMLSVQTESDHITVAELKSVEKNGLSEVTDINTALVSSTLISKIKSSLVNPVVKTSSAYYDEAYEYKPAFWLCLSRTLGLAKAEPLVVSWCSGNHTTLTIDQGFLSAFKLSPRLLKEEIIWDDLKEPEYDVVKNKLLSEYDFPAQSEAFVKIKKNYLETYLSCRKKVAVQVFNVKREISIDKEISFLLQENEYYSEELKQCLVTIRRFDHKENAVQLEINGFKILFENSKDNDNEEIVEGHHWKGVEGLVTTWRATHEMPFEYVYISDKVMAIYEADEDYEVYPLTGSVSYRNQWSVSHCERVGKNAIKVEIKKLYEGNRLAIIDYWNKFSIHPSEIVDGENIALKSKRLVKQFFLFGRLLADLSNHFFGCNYSPKDIIGLDEEKISYTGWIEFPEFIAVAQHLDLKSFSKEQYVSRCKKLYILIGENLQEKTLRKIVNILGFPLSETKEFRSIKLLELIIAYLDIANDSGLDPAKNKETLVERVLENKKLNSLLELSALNFIRQLDAHKANDSKPKLHNALNLLGIQPNSISNNYASACEQTFDSLNNMFRKLNELLNRSIDKS